LTPLNDICNQDIFKTIVLNSLNRNRIASTYLFYGDEGVGKWLGAIALACLVNCENPLRDENGDVTDACGQCRNCHQISGYNFAEMYFAIPLPPHRSASEEIDLSLEYINRKKEEPYSLITSTRQLTIPINVAREIKRRTAIKPPRGLKRIILFDQMEKMLASSADSLLKMIEEPPPETIIILTARDPENLLPTIQSRAQKIRFRPIPKNLIADYLIRKYELTSEKAEFYARLARGSVGRAVGAIDDETESSVRQNAFLIFKGFFTRDNPSAASIVMDLVNQNNRGETTQILSWWQSFLGDLIILKYGRDISNIQNIDLKAELGKLADKITPPDGFSRILDEIKETQFSLRRNVHIRPAMTSLAFRIKRHINQSA